MRVGREEKQTNQHIFVREGDKLEWRVLMVPCKWQRTLTLFVVVLNNLIKTWRNGKVYETTADGEDQAKVIQ